MSLTPLQGSAQVLELSENNSTWRSLVCLNAISHDITGNVNTVQTNCGPAVGVGTPTFKWSISAVCSALRDSTTEASFRDCAVWCNSGTTLYIRWRNAASGSVSQSIAWNESSQVIISSVKQTANNGEVVKFDVEIEGQGTLTIA